MPNWVTNRIVIAGSEDRIASLRTNLLVVEDDELIVDFRKVIPMPESIARTEKSGSADIGRAALGAGDLGKVLSWRWVREAGITSVEELRAYVERTQPEAIVAAQATIDAEKETGFPDWYEWSVAKWGTKWNSCGLYEASMKDGRWEFLMNTAWSPPIPVLEAIAEQYPDLQIEVVYFDEGWCFAGFGYFEGELSDDQECEASAELYERVFGEPPPDECEDENKEEVCP